MSLGVGVGPGQEIFLNGQGDGFRAFADSRASHLGFEATPLLTLLCVERSGAGEALLGRFGLDLFVDSLLLGIRQRDEAVDNGFCLLGHDKHFSDDVLVVCDASERGMACMTKAVPSSSRR